MNKFIHPYFGQQFSPEYMKDIKKMVKQYQDLLNEDFWDGMNNINHTKRERVLQQIPTEVWESEDQFFIHAFIPKVTHNRYIKIYFPDEESISIKTQIPVQTPGVGAKLIHSTIPKTLKCKIELAHEIDTENYTSNLENGVLTIILKKIDPANDDYDLPIDF